MADRGERTHEALILEKYPEIRVAVSESEEFRAWKENLPAVDIDEVQYYVRGGDMLKDEDQIILEWARRFRPGILPTE